MVGIYWQGRIWQSQEAGREEIEVLEQNKKQTEKNLREDRGSRDY